MTKSAKWLIAVLVAITAVSVITVVFMAAHRPDTDEEDEEEAVKTPSHVMVQNGRAVISLDRETQAREGIRVSPLVRRSLRADLRGTAVLLAVADLPASRNSYIAARAKVARDQVNLNVARSQYQRLKTLYEQNQNASLKSMQDAEAAYRNAQAQVRADEQVARLQLDVVRQRWGASIADWVANSTPDLEEILVQREFLAQVTFPPGEVATPPATVTLTLPGRKLARARFVSPFPQVNPQIQGIGFLYLVPSRPGMAVGMNLAVLIPAGPLRRGAVVPENAIVWWQGNAWTYEATSPTTFVRREVSTGNPVANGYFVPGAAFAPGAKVVTVGAQALLSEEFRSQLKTED